jgi:uncharacterized protein YndB with AHSA1/START domain
MRELPPCELDWIERAPVVLRVSTHIKAPPAAVFARFADAASWPRWFPMMTRAVWLDGATGAVGAEREVSLRGLGTFRERFLAFEAPHRFAFTVIASTSGMLRRFGEDYRLTAEGDGSRFDWTMGTEPSRLGRLLAPGMRLVMRRILARAARNLERGLAQQTSTYANPAASSK